MNHDITLQALFLSAVSTYPNNIAIAYDNNGFQECLTYKELSERAAKVSAHLKNFCLQDNEVIAIYSRQFPGLYACILGILNIPAAFAPVGTEWPAKLACDFLSRLETRIIVVDIELWEGFQQIALNISKSKENSDSSVIYNQDLLALGFIIVNIDANRRKTSIPYDLAYIMQTSGTTGKPKLVKVPHQCIVPNVISLGSIFTITEFDSVALISPYTFDPFVVQLFLALSSGGRAVVVQDSVKLQPVKLCDLLFVKQMVTIFQPTPSLMNYLGPEIIKTKVLGQYSSLRVLALGGESCPPFSTLHQWMHPSCQARVFNLYGITEVSSWATCYEVNKDNIISSENLSRTQSINNVEETTSDLLNTVDLNDNIPLGPLLLDTVIEVRDDHGVKISQGVGQIFVGGFKRVCLLDDELSAPPGTMRATGDWGYIHNDQIWYCGRKDRQIKRQGKRVNLLWIEQVLTRDIPIATFAAVVGKAPEKMSVETLYLFVTMNGQCHEDVIGLVKTALINLLPVYAHPDRIVVVPGLPMTPHGKVDTRTLLHSIQSNTQEEDASLSIKEIVTRLWMGSLGWNKDRDPKDSGISSTSSQVKGSQNYTSFEDHPRLGCFNKSPTDDEDMFIACGGTSIQAIQLANNLESWLKTKHHRKDFEVPDLLDVILNQPFCSLCGYIKRQAGLRYPYDGIDRPDLLAGRFPNTLSKQEDSTNESELIDSCRGKLDENELGGRMKYDSEIRCGEQAGHKEEHDLSNDGSSEHYCTTMMAHGKKRRKVDAEEIVIPSNSSSKVNKDTQKANRCFCSIRRGSQYKVCKNCQDASSTHTETTTHQEVATLLPENTTSGIQFNSQIQFVTRWCTDLYKCIDASPLVVGVGADGGEVGNEAPVTYIGSHAHVIKAVSLYDGKALWETRLGDRIESSAVVSQCGLYIIMGCYDGKVYVLNRHDGHIHWTFQTSGPVKSSACVDPSTGLVWIGSHDHCLYALDVTRQLCACAVDVGGSCFASPCVDPTRHVIYAATLSGDVLAVDAVEYGISWRARCPKPLFASPLVTLFGIICGCVNGVLYAFNHEGVALWEFEASGPIFSSPVYCRDESPGSDNGRILFGCHDSCVYCVSSGGSLKWKFNADSPVYATPFVRQKQIPASQLDRADLPYTNPSSDIRDVEGSLTVDAPDNVLGNATHCNAMKRHCIANAGENTGQLFDPVGKVVSKNENISTPDNIRAAIRRSSQYSSDHYPRTVNQSQETVNQSQECKRDEDCTMASFPSPLGTVFVCSTSGTLYALSSSSGDLLGSQSLPGQVFSSPVVVDNTVVIGCRDNYLYSLRIVCLK